MLQFPLYRPGRSAADITMLLLVCVCERDQVTPSATTERVAGRAPRGEIKHYDADHFSIYVGDLWERVITDQLEFLKRHVPLPSVL